jgi:hypothetical protein
MNLEQQICSLELAKRLKELGVKQDSFLYWANKDLVSSIDLDLLLDNNKVRSQSFINNSWPDQNILELYSAFTVAELLEILPLINGCPLQLLKGHKITDCVPTYYARYDQLPMHYETIESLVDINPANTLAKILIYLIENGLIKNESN